MASNVIGVFDSVDVADQVVSDLTSSGFDSSTVSSYKGSSGDLSGELQSAGLDADEASEYASSVGQGGALVVVQADDSQTDDAVAIMNRYYSDADMQSSDASYASGSAASSGSDEATFAVAEEQLQIGKRTVQRGGVRVRSVVSEKEVEEQVSLRDETVHVERRPVNRAVSNADTDVFKEQSVEMTETDEEVMVAKEARIVEEVVVGKEVGQRTETVRDTVRRTDVEIEDLATSYGQNLASNAQYSGREWNDIEGDARTSWEKENKDQGTWDSVRNSVRSSWEKFRG